MGNTCEVVLPHEQNHGSTLRLLKQICILMTYMLHGRTLKDELLLISYCRLLAISAEVWDSREGQMNLRPWVVCVHRDESRKCCVQRLESGRSSSLLACTSAGPANPSFQTDTSADGTPLGGIDPWHRRSGGGLGR